MKKYLNNFFEVPMINSRIEARRFIEDYGVDGEKTYTKKEEEIYDPEKRIYKTGPKLRNFCKDCADKKCQGEKWDNCEYRICFLVAVNKELDKQNQELREKIKGQ